ncbi:MAG: ATP-binding protein [Methylacidiphilales bacterium]|nr:ATP-binding protein [Candidatus Methylacidiphilales bacterium]
METTLRRTITNEVHELESLMNATTNFLEDQNVDAQAVYRVKLALEEMITNIIKHGYDDYESHQIDVAIELRPEEIVGTITDDGHEFNPLEQELKNKNAALPERKVGGLGIHIIKELLNEVNYRRENEKNILEIKMRRNQPA